MGPADRPVSTILWFLCRVATLVVFAACIYFHVIWGPLFSFGFVGVLVTALGLSLIAYVALGLTVATVMVLEVKREDRTINRNVRGATDNFLDRVEAEMWAGRGETRSPGQTPSEPFSHAELMEAMERVKAQRLAERALDQN
jgi:uncharacterized membrane protein